MVAMTGTRPWEISRSTMVGSTDVTSPTKPSASERTSARIRLASTPERPTARDPWTLIDATMSLLTLPTSTIRATSRVSASVTRSPSRNSDVMPIFLSSSPICGPPPCTTTGLSPTACNNTMSSANVASASASFDPANAFPPYFTTTTAPANLRI